MCSVVVTLGASHGDGVCGFDVVFGQRDGLLAEDDFGAAKMELFHRVPEALTESANMYVSFGSTSLVHRDGSSQVLTSTRTRPAGAPHAKSSSASSHHSQLPT